MQPRSGLYTVGDFMTKKEDLHVVKPTTSVDEGIFSYLVHVLFQSRSVFYSSSPFFFVVKGREDFLFNS